MHPGAALLTSLSVGGVHCLATLWEITREDGEVFRFTDHDEALLFEGQTFEPSAAFGLGAARQQDEGLRAATTEVRGAIVSDRITHEDLLAGKFRRAIVREYVVDWRFPWAGHILHNVHRIDEATFSINRWEANMRGQIGQLDRQIGELYTRTCRWKRLGNAQCGVDLDLWRQEDRTVAGVLTPGKLFTSDVTGEDGHHESGVITWVTGLNAGLVSAVKEHLEDSGTLRLQVSPPFAIQVGDTFDIVPGCDRTVETCLGKFDNVVRFGGFPDIPGNDKLFETPSSEE